MNRRIAIPALLALLLMLLVACGGTGSPSSSSATAPAAGATAPAATNPTAATAPTDAPAAATAAPSAAAPTDAPAAATAAPTGAVQTGGTGGTRTFSIVPDQSEASYEVQETFLRQNLPYTAVGKTNQIEGEFQFSNDGKPTGQVSRIVIDLRTLKSDNDRRDNAIRENWLESNKYPYAEFTSTEAQGLPDSYTEGRPVSFKLLGTMKIRDVTKPVTFDVTGTLNGDTVTGTATTSILMKDFGFDPPTIAGAISVQDGVKIKVDFTAKQK